MQVILLENILKLGKIGDQVEVKNGFGRNYLLRQGKALRASKENIEFVSKKKSELTKKNEEIKNQFKETVVFKGTNNRGEMVLISHNPLTKSWTALNQYQGQFFCVVAFGAAGLVMPEVEYDRDSKPKPN